MIPRTILSEKHNLFRQTLGAPLCSASLTSRAATGQ